jgi:hypothetical protein
MSGNGYTDLTDRVTTDIVKVAERGIDAHVALESVIEVERQVLLAHVLSGAALSVETGIPTAEDIERAKQGLPPMGEHEA